MNNEQGRVLVVDDDPLNVLRMARYLRQQGHNVETVNDGRQALEMLRAEPFDVVLLDLIMPDMDGRQVLKVIKQENELRDIPVIIISALDEEDSVVECIEQGAEDYLTKPFKPAVLKARLNASLGKKKLRDLEIAYLEQEMALRNNEKLATLGKLSAGMAHELNNPVAAVLRGTEHMSAAIQRQHAAQMALVRSGLSDGQTETLAAISRQAEQQANRTGDLDAITRSEREADLEDWLYDVGVGDAWEMAPALVEMGYDTAALAVLASAFTSEQLTDLFDWTASRFLMFGVLREICEGSNRVADIVRALKSFTYLDQAPVQNVDVHAGLDDTLIMLRGKLKIGVSVSRDYADDVPLIEARGTELNQVWTNIIDNAIDAMGGQGELRLRTRWDKPWVVVEIEDNGPGIPESIQGQLFDPFFTTKAPGEGTGLGLNISHNIIVQKHGGTLSVTSKPGQTVFQAQLPICLAEIGEG